MEKLVTLAVALGAAMVLGCGSGDPGGRKAVEGTVAYAGAPLEEGQIVFEPIESGAPLAAGQIRQGAYRIDSAHGPTPGAYRVRIEGYRKKRDPSIPPHPYLGEDHEAGVVAEQFLPLEYNARTTLNVEITTESRNTHNFDLPEKR